MKIPLKERIMDKIGFGRGIDPASNTPLNAIFRQMTIPNLSRTIRRFNAEGEPISKPHAPLIQMVRDISSYVDDQFGLYNTHKAVGEVIDAHIEAHGKPASERKKIFQALKDEWKRRHRIEASAAGLDW